MINYIIRSVYLAAIVLCTLNSVAYSQIDTSYSFIVAGHAYGAHSGVNIGLYSKLLNSLNSGYDSNSAFIVFTGDIVRESTSESWQQVENELNGYALPYYYVMGNHDDNDIGHQVFTDKFGGAYYSFHQQSELFIVLNSTEEQRSISPNQLSFLQEQIDSADDAIHNIFIFFHEVLWNSHEKYAGVKSNSRSRYSNILKYSNYWEEVHPMLTGKPSKKFYLIAGDVGGNADAVAAFYDTCDQITFVASGMGEVADENYLLVRLQDKDSPEFELVPLNPGLELPGLEYFSVPPAAQTIAGPSIVIPGSNSIEYSVPEVFNAGSYSWEIPEGTSGSSSSNLINVSFAADFTEGNISVRAYREGFGSGPASSIMVKADNSAIEARQRNAGSPLINISENSNYLTIGIDRVDRGTLIIRLLDTSGRLILVKQVDDFDKYTEFQINKTEIPKGIILLSISTQAENFIKKIAIW